MSRIVLSPAGRALAHGAVLAALDGGTLELADDTRRLVTLTLGEPAFAADGTAHPLTPGYGLAKGRPTRVACLTQDGTVIASGPASGLTLEPAEIEPGAKVTVTAFRLTGA